jgi:hypothetical protein
MSGAFVVPEIVNELGMVPPSLLPIGNRMLLELQVESLRNKFDDPITLTLPSSYVLTRFDLSLFNKLNLECLAVPDGLSLADSLMFALKADNSEDQRLRILHGDTLIQDLPTGLDQLSIGVPQADYDWEFKSGTFNSDQREAVWSGFFSFSDKYSLERSIASSESNFVKAVRNYNAEFNSKNVFCPNWLDFGHVTSYFLSRSSITTQRSFNSLSIANGVLVKSGEQANKIKAEEYWFKNIPPNLRKYSPLFINSGINSQNQYFYSLEYLPFLPLNELFVFGKNGYNFWNRQFKLIKSFLSQARESYKVNELYLENVDQEFTKLIEKKSIKRLDEFLGDDPRHLDTVMVKFNDRCITIREIRDECIKKSLSGNVIPSILHGDLCLSNILYDSRSNRLKLIDPRGLTEDGHLSIIGNQIYDVAKLGHSVIGLYDFIISGHYTISTDQDGFSIIEFEIDDRVEMIQKIFITQITDNEHIFNEIIYVVILLFLSMLPLHADRPDRQEAMILNAVRLYKIYVLK